MSKETPRTAAALRLGRCDPPKATIALLRKSAGLMDRPVSATSFWYSMAKKGRVRKPRQQGAT
jgi:hypothetical protein